MIAIALSCDPKLLIADEPTTALDVTVQASVLDLLDDLRHEHDMAMIIITHDMGVVAEAADDIIVMYAGQIVEHASTLDLFDNPEHPYTEALLGALPQIEGEGVRQGRLTAIPGRPPDLIDPPRRAASRPAARMPATTTAPRTCPSCARCARATGSARPIRRASGRDARRRGCGRERSGRRCSRSTELHKHFPIRAGLLIERKVGEVARSTTSASRSAEGETLGLVGESGSGKSTTGYCVLQLLKPTSGSVMFEGTELTDARPRGSAPDAPRDADRLPGPVLVARSAHDRRRHRRRAADRARDRHARATAPSGSASCSTSSASTRATRTATRTSSRAASGSGSGSRARSRSARS